LRDAAERHAILGFASELFEGLAGLDFGGQRDRTFGAEEEEEQDDDEYEDEEDDKDDSGGVLFPIGGRD
jgi:hypothetical protein